MDEFARGAQEAGCSVEKVLVAFTETMLASLRGFTCCVPEAKEGGVVLGVNAMEAGDIRKTDAVKQAYEMGKSV